MLNRILESAGRIVQKPVMVVAAGLFFSGVLLVIFVLQPPFLRSMDNKIFDTFLISSTHSEVSPIPVIVDLDERSLSVYGQWPWPRYRVALLVEKVRRAGAIVIATDIVFSEFDHSSPKLIQEELLKEMGVNVEFVGLPEALMDNDQVLANVLAHGPYVLAYYFSFEGELSSCSNRLHPVQTVITRAADAAEPSAYFFNALGAVCNLDVLSQAASHAGFFNTVADSDGIIRRSPLLVRFQDNYYPSLALAVVMKAVGTNQIIVKMNHSGIDLKIGPMIIPLDRQGNMLIHYRGPSRTFPYISAADILEDKIPAGSLEGRVVFIGTSAAGLKDLRITPFDRNSPGVEVHATITDNILTNDYLKKPGWSMILELATALVVGVVSTLLLAWLPAYACLVVVVAGVCALWGSSSWIFHSKNLFVSPLMPLVLLCINFSGLSLFKFWREESEKNYFRSAFSKYVSKSVVDQLVKTRAILSLSGMEKEVSILFSDIRGFTSISETMTSEQVSRILRTYFTPMTKLITEHQGTLDKFIGDAIMAFWNAPLDIKGHQLKALRSSLAMLEELDKLNIHFTENFNLTLDIGIGLHSGRVSVGNMGSADLFDYTIIGDNVNLASRIEGLTKRYGMKLLVTEPIKESCYMDEEASDLEFIEIDRVRVKGREKPVILYAVVTMDEFLKRRIELEQFQSAMQLYHAGQFKASAHLFDRLAESYSHTRIYHLFSQRCQDLIQNPPEQQWDGVFSHTTK